MVGDVWSYSCLLYTSYDVLRRSQPDADGRPPEELNLPTDTNIAREVEQRDEVNQVRPVSYTHLKICIAV